MRITRSPQFDKDIEQAKQDGKDMSIIENVIRILAAGDEPPTDKYNKYPGSGFMRSYYILFLQADWVLIYKPTDDELRLSRTGSPGIAS